MTDSNLNKPKKKKDPALKFMGKLDKGIFDAQAKTVDFFDNTFLGNKRSLDEIKANRQKIIDEANAKKEEIFKEYSDKTAVDDVIRAGLSVPFHLVNETNNQVRGLFSAVQGNPYEENDIFDLEALRLKTEGDDESLAYGLTQTIGQFAIPFGGFSKGLKTVGLSSKGFKAAGVSDKAFKIGRKTIKATDLAKPTRFFVAGQLTDAFNFSPYEENLFDLANQWGAIRNPVFEYLGAADEEIPFLEAKFKQQLSGGLAGEIVGGGIKGIAKGSGKLADVGADLFSKKTGDSLTNFFTSLNSVRQNPLKKQKALETFSEYQKTTLSEADTLSKTDLDLITDESDDVFDEILNYRKPSTDVSFELPDTRGQNEFYHGAASDVELIEGGEFGKAVENLYGDGFYTTDDLVTGAKYQKKNRVKGKKPSGVVYKVTEKQPVKFFDLDAPATPERIDQMRQVFGFGDYEEMIERAIDNVGPNASIGKIYDELKLISNSYEKSAADTADLFSSFTEQLQREGFGGFTHQGGNKAGKGKRLHKVKIYFDPANSIDIEKINLNDFSAPPKKLPKNLIPTETNQSIPSRKTLPPVQEEAELIYNAIDEARTKDPNFLKVMTDEMQIQRSFRLMKQPDYVIEKLEDIWRRYGDQTKYTQRDFVLAGSMLQGRNAKNIDRLAAVLEEARLTNNEELYNRTSEVFVNKWTEFLRLAFPVKNVTGEAAGTTRVRQLANEQLRVPSIDESIKDPSKTKNVSSSRLNVLGQIEKLKKQQKDEKLIQDLFPSKEELVEKLRNKDTSDLLDFTRKLRTAAGDAQKLQDLLVEKGPEGKLRKSVATGLEISKEIYVNQLLGAPETQKVNIYTGLINTLLGPADYLSVAAFDGNPTGVARGVGEIISQLLVFGDSMKMAGKAFKMNRNILAPANVKLVVEEGSAIKRVGESIKTGKPFDKSIGPIAINNESVSDVVKTVGTIINLPGRFTQSFGDELIKQQIFRSGALPMIIEKGYNSGLRGKQLHKFTNKVFEEVNTMMLKQSIKGASDLAMEVYETQALQSIERTFTRPLGTGYGKSLTKPMSKVLKHPALSFVNAFVGTPINISKAAIRRFGTLPTAPFTRYDESAPGGALNKLFSGTVNRKGKPINIGFGNLLKEYNDAMLSDDYATRAKAIGEARVGQAMLLTFALMAKAKDDPEAEIVLVGAGPRHYSAQKVREENGEIPNSFGFLAKDELGEVIYGPDGRPERYYIQFGRLDPFAGPLQVMGDFPDVIASLDIEDQEEAGSILVALARRQIQDAPFLGGLSEFLGMTDNADNFARYLARQVLLRTTPGFASVEDIAKGLGMPESTVKYLGIGTLGLSKIPVPMPQTLARSIKRSQQYDYYDGMTGITYKIQNPRFDKKIKKGDLTNQEIREDGTLKNQDKIPLVTDFFTRFGINYLRELSMGVNGWDADLEPIRNKFTGKFQEYPVGLGYKNFNPIKTSRSENNPITTFMQDIGYRPVKLPSEIYGGIYLNQAEWTQINNSIPLLKDEDGVGVQEKYLNFINDPEVQQRLKIITEGVEAIDSQRSKTLRDKYIKELRTGWHKIYKDSEERAIYDWITKPEQVESGKLDAYLNDLEALNEEYNTNLDL